MDKMELESSGQNQVDSNSDMEEEDKAKRKAGQKIWQVQPIEPAEERLRGAKC